jgi:hypothetical protein
MQILGISRSEFESRVKLALESATGNTPKLSSIRKTTVLLCHGGTGQGQSEHTLEQFFSDTPAYPAQASLSPETVALIVSLLTSLDKAVAKDFSVCEASLKQCPLNSEELPLARLAIAFAMYRDLQDMPEDFQLAKTPLAGHLGQSVCERIEQLIPPVHELRSLHDSPWERLIKTASTTSALQQAIAISYCYETLVREGPGGNPILRLSSVDVFDTLTAVPEHWRQHCKSLTLACIDDALSAVGATRSEAEENGL